MTHTTEVLPGQEPLFGVDEAGPVAEQLEPRARIHRHLFAHPGLTAAGLAEALGMKERSVLRHLSLMEDDGEAERGSGRPTQRKWWAT